MSSLNLGVIGNGTIGAMIDERGTIVWACFSRIDGDPVFSALVDDNPDAGPDACPDAGGVIARAGTFAITLVDTTVVHQSYVENTAVLRTELTDSNGNSIAISDCCPRFIQYERTYRPPLIFRRVTPLKGTPRVQIIVRPRFGYGSITPQITRGSNHIRYVSAALSLRLTTDAPVTYVKEETPFILDRPINLVFGADESLTMALDEGVRTFIGRTEDWWRRWVRSLSVPFEWQAAVIRAAITLKLCNFDESGAIVAALTTSIPEAPDSERTWDYRYCWLRDAYFVIQALNRLGATDAMEGYISFISNIVGESDERSLRPLYGINRMAELPERNAQALRGYRGMGPVRVGNQAFTQAQNDVYGSVILATTHAFFDRRLVRPGNHELFGYLERLGASARAVFDQPDAGPWELRNDRRVHTFSSVMCWAACDRLARVARALGLTERGHYWSDTAATMHDVITERAWNPRLNSFVATFDGDALDATLLLLHEIDFVTADDPRFAATVDAVANHLKAGDFLFRYVTKDDFGTPKTAFTICTYWYIDALAALGRRAEARTLFETMLRCRNPLGLLSEDIDPDTRELWGNFPQTYSMVGLINSAVRLSDSWEEAF